MKWQCDLLNECSKQIDAQGKTTLLEVTRRFFSLSFQLFEARMTVVSLF